MLYVNIRFTWRWWELCGRRNDWTSPI